jgi:L-fuculose-phosphate aldolase
MSMTGSKPTRHAVIAVAQAMLSRGLVVSTVGNVSARRGDAFLITPTRRHPDDLHADDLVEVALGWPRTDDGPHEASLEWRLHAAIYSARPDVDGIVHTHSPHATARSFNLAPLVIETEERTYFDVDRIEVSDPAPAGSSELARACTGALGPRPAVILAKHGVVGVGATPRDALEMCCFVEHQSQISELVARSGLRALAQDPRRRG